MLSALTVLLPLLQATQQAPAPIWTPGGSAGANIEPDEVIPAASTANSDPQLERAIQSLKSLSSCAR